MAAIGLLILRLVLAVVLAAHGAHKLFGFLGGPGIGPGGLEQTAALYAGMGLKPPFLLAVLAAVAQFVGGICLAVGLFARWAAGASLIYILIGIWVEHRKWGLFLNWLITPGRGHGVEYSIIFAAALLMIILGGAGSFSIDGRRDRHKEARAAGRARLRNH